MAIVLGLAGHGLPITVCTYRLFSAWAWIAMSLWKGMRKRHYFDVLNVRCAILPGIPISETQVIANLLSVGCRFVLPFVDGRVVKVATW